MRHGPIARLVMVIAGLLVLGIVLKLLMTILEPILPATLLGDLEAGWQILRGIVAPAMPAVFAAAILGALCWAVMGWWRRY